MSVAGTMAAYAADVNAALTCIFQDFISQAAEVHPSVLEMADAISRFTSGPGKRIRPILMRVAYEGFGGTDTDGIVRASCALEFLQTFFLLHDDIMDRSDLRRGQPTVHREYATRYQHRMADPQHFGQAMGILAGNLAGQQASLLLSRAPFPSHCVARGLARCAEVAVDVCYGQALDMMLPHKPLAEVTEDELLRVAEYKTARYTTEGPLHLGAIFAGADEEDLASLSAYAVPVGVAFQLQDDLLGIFGDAATIGKSADSDLLEGKRTLPVLRAWQMSDRSQRDLLERSLGNPNATPAELNTVRDVIASTGARSATMDLMAQFIDSAKTSLKGAGLAPDMTEFLCSLADYIARRDR